MIGYGGAGKSEAMEKFLSGQESCCGEGQEAKE